MILSSVTFLTFIKLLDSEVIETKLGRSVTLNININTNHRHITCLKI